MTTIRNMIRRSFRQIGIASANEDISSEDLDVAKQSMASLLDSWSTNPNISWSLNRTTFDITKTDTEVVFETRPVRITDVTFNLGTIVYPMVQVDHRDFYRISVPEAGFPHKFMWDGELTIKLIGRGNGVISVVYQPELVDLTQDIDQELTFPPGYENALVYNVSVMLCDEYGRTPTQTLLSSAESAYSSILSPNYRPKTIYLSTGSMFGGRGGYSDVGRTSLAASMGG